MNIAEVTPKFLSAPYKITDSKMRGTLDGNTFETPDGQKYYKQKADANETKLYFRCKNYAKGCKAVLHTKYTDRDDKDLKVIFKSGQHNHKSSECGVGRGRKRRRYGRVESDEDGNEEDDDDCDGRKRRRYARVESNEEDSDLEEEEEDEEGESGDGEADDGGSEEDEAEEDGSEEREEDDDGDEEDGKNVTSEHDDETREEVAEETVEGEMIRISNGVGIMKYVQFLNWLGEEDLAEKVQYTAPIEFKMIYNIMHLYQECVKGDDYLIKDPKLTKEFLIKMRTFRELGANGCKHKNRVHALLDKDFLRVLRGVLGHFARDPTFIFKAIVKSKYKNDSTVGFEAIYGP